MNKYLLGLTLLLAVTNSVWILSFDNSSVTKTQMQDVPAASVKSNAHKEILFRLNDSELLLERHTSQLAALEKHLNGVKAEFTDDLKLQTIFKSQGAEIDPAFQGASSSTIPPDVAVPPMSSAGSLEQVMNEIEEGLIQPN